MITDAKNLTIGLDNSGRKFNCPQCNQKRFVRMKDFETGGYLPDQVGRCDRESNCGYHMTVKQYFINRGLDYKPTLKPAVQLTPVRIDFMKLEYIEKTMNGFNETNFAAWLVSLFGNEITESALLQYFVARSRNDNGKASIFWRIDLEGNLRTGKVICYNPFTGKRNKDKGAYMVHPRDNFNCVLPFFGEHLVSEYPTKTIGIVESEKTAIIASIFMPDIIWLATGGNSGCRWREWSVFKVLKNRNVILFPDFGYFNKATQKTCFEEWSDRAANIRDRIPCSITVSRLLEDLLPMDERVNDYDLADMLVKTETLGGLAMVEPGYPAIFDLYPKN